MQQMWLRSTKKVDEATLALGLVLATAQEYHKMIIRLFLYYSDNSQEKSPNVLGRITTESLHRVREDKNLQMYFISRKFRENAATAKFGVENKEFCKLAHQLVKSAIGMEMILMLPSATGEQVFGRALKEDNICKKLEKKVDQSIKNEKIRVNFFLYFTVFGRYLIKLYRKIENISWVVQFSRDKFIRIDRKQTDAPDKAKKTGWKKKTNLC